MELLRSVAGKLGVQAAKREIVARRCLWRRVEELVSHEPEAPFGETGGSFCRVLGCLGGEFMRELAEIGVNGGFLDLCCKRPALTDTGAVILANSRESVK